MITYMSPELTNLHSPQRRHERWITVGEPFHKELTGLSTPDDVPIEELFGERAALKPLLSQPGQA